MVISPQHFREITNGYEKRSDGLWMHKGRVYFGGFDGPPNYSQAGIRGQTDTASTYSLLVTNHSQTKNLLYIRDDGQVYTDQLYVGTSATLPPNSIGSSQIQDGAVGTADIATNAVQQLIGFFATNVPAWNTTTTASWVPTPVAATFTTSGGQLRAEGSVLLMHSAAGAGYYVGLGWDGAMQVGMAYANCAGANYTNTITFVYYLQLAAGQHTITVYVYNAGAGTLTLNQATGWFLWITEQKR